MEDNLGLGINLCVLCCYTHTHTQSRHVWKISPRSSRKPLHVLVEKELSESGPPSAVHVWNCRSHAIFTDRRETKDQEYNLTLGCATWTVTVLTFDPLFKYAISLHKVNVWKWVFMKKWLCRRSIFYCIKTAFVFHQMSFLINECEVFYS